MATKRATVKKQPVSEQDQAQDQQLERGYAGSQDYQTGKVSSSDPAQATDEQIKKDRERQRGVVETDDE